MNMKNENENIKQWPPRLDVDNDVSVGCNTERFQIFVLRLADHSSESRSLWNEHARIACIRCICMSARADIRNFAYCWQILRIAKSLPLANAARTVVCLPFYDTIICSATQNITLTMHTIGLNQFSDGTSKRRFIWKNGQTKVTSNKLQHNKNC